MMKSNVLGLLFLLLCSTTTTASSSSSSSSSTTSSSSTATSSSSSSVLGNDSVVVKNYVHVLTPLTWLEAQAYCRSVLRADLATIVQSDVGRILTDSYLAWVGYYELAHWFSESYFWLDQQHTGEDADERKCGLVGSDSKLFYVLECQQHLFFICQSSHTPNYWNYTLVLQSKTWREALEYCRDKFHSLAILDHQSKVDAAVVQQDFPVWIGLHREGRKWKWSRGFSSYRAWASDGSVEDGDCVALSSTTKKMSPQDCDARFPFVCLRENLILVKENKTWEEALEHCRASGNELVSVQPGEDHQTVMDYVMEAKTDQVWTGLRFLAGDWLWVNKATLRYSELPPCPQQGQQCGALAKKDTGSVEGTDCLLKLNFLCYSST